MFDSAESCYLLTTGKTAGIELLFMFAIVAVPTSDLKLKNVFGFFFIFALAMIILSTLLIVLKHSSYC